MTEQISLDPPSQRRLADHDRAGPLVLLQDLYAAGKEDQAFFRARFVVGDDVLKPYKATSDRWLWPDVFKRLDVSVVKAKKAVSDYRKAIGSSPGLADLAVYYCELAAGVCRDVGLPDENCFNALIRMFEQALKTVATLPESDGQALLTRLNIVRQTSHEFGYGVGDDMDELCARNRIHGGSR